MANLRWANVAALLRVLGAEMSEREGSRVGVKLHGRRLVLHRPHPVPELRKYAVEAIRDFLTNAGVGPEDGETK